MNLFYKYSVNLITVLKNKEGCCLVVLSIFRFWSILRLLLQSFLSAMPPTTLAHTD